MSSLTHVASAAAVEAFTDGTDNIDWKELISKSLVTALYLIILLFAGEYLWNNVVVQLFTFAKPAKSIWQILGLVLVFWIVMPGY
jgi:hypothetical protein